MRFRCVNLCALHSQCLPKTVFDIGSGKFQGRGLPVEAYRERVVHLLQASDSAMLVHHSSDPFDAVVKDILLGVTSFPFSFPQLGLYLLDFRS